MNWSVILGILGIFVSIGVGWLTYHLSYRRSRNHRYVSAKATILHELSRSLGEDSVPSPVVLEAVIRSVLRETGGPMVTITVEDLLDDLLRRVTSDPFLNSDRRRKLQDDIQAARGAFVDASQPNEDAEIMVSGTPGWEIFNTVISTIAGFITLSIFAFAYGYSRDAGSFLRFFIANPLLSLIVILFFISVWLAIAKRRGRLRRLLRWPASGEPRE